MNIVVTEFVSLDGVMESPEKWSLAYWNDDISEFKFGELKNTDAHLLGRNTYEGFAAAWPSRSGEFADLMNRLPKYVVSTSLDDVEWENSHLIQADVPEEIARLKKKPGKTMLVAGSCTLVQTLIKHNLVDEYHLLVYPLVLGSGKRLFDEDTSAKLSLVETRPVGSGVVLVRYQPATDS